LRNTKLPREKGGGWGKKGVKKGNGTNGFWQLRGGREASGEKKGQRKGKNSGKRKDGGHAPMKKEVERRTGNAQQS